MLVFLRNRKMLCIVVYAALFLELLVPHAHTIGRFSDEIPPHERSAPHVERSQPETVFHTLSQLYRDHLSFSFLPTELLQLSFDCFTAVSRSYSEYSKCFYRVRCSSLFSTRAPPSLNS